MRTAEENEATAISPCACLFHRLALLTPPPPHPSRPPLSASSLSSVTGGTRSFLLQHPWAHPRLPGATLTTLHRHPEQPAGPPGAVGMSRGAKKTAAEKGGDEISSSDEANSEVRVLQRRGGGGVALGREPVGPRGPPSARAPRWSFPPVLDDVRRSTPHHLLLTSRPRSCAHSSFPLLLPVVLFPTNRTIPYNPYTP